ncbi:lipopolysaccharide biosynthesis protein [Alsobacter sp. R-9]
MSGPAALSPQDRPPSHRSLIGASALFALGNGLSRAVSYAMPPVLAAWIAPAEMGTVALLTFAALIGRTVLGLGLTTSAGAVYFQVPEAERDAVIGVTALIIAAGSAAGLLLCAAAAPLVSAIAPDASPRLALLAFAGVALQLLAQPYTMALQFDRRPLAHLMVTAASAVAGVGLTLGMVAVAGRGVLGWLEAGVVAGVLGVILSAIVAGKRSVAWNKDVAARLVRLGWPFVPGAAFMAVIQGAAPFVLARMAGIETAGVFNAGYGLGMIMSLATTGFASAWFPYFQSYASRPDEAGPAFSKILTACIGAFGAAAVLFYAAAPLAFLVIDDPRYAGAVSYVGDVALLQAMIGIWGVLVPVLYFRDRIWIASAVQGLGAVATVASTPVLVGMVGAGVAALGGVVGAGVMTVAQLIVNRRIGTAAGTFADLSHGTLAVAALIAAFAARAVAATAAPVVAFSAGTVLALGLLILASVALGARWRK